MEKYDIRKTQPGQNTCMKNYYLFFQCGAFFLLVLFFIYRILNFAMYDLSYIKFLWVKFRVYETSCMIIPCINFII